MPENAVFKCNLCQRIVLYPDRKFRFCTLCSDDTGAIALMLNDREVRMLTGRTVFTLANNDSFNEVLNQYPEEFQNLLNVDITAMVELSEENLSEGCNFFTASEVLLGHIDSMVLENSVSRHNILSQDVSHFSQGSTSTTDYHLEVFNEMKILTLISSHQTTNKMKDKKFVDF